MHLDFGTSALATRARLSDTVARRLLDHIRAEARPGGRLPSERALARTFGVSQPTVREALRTLEAMGVVSISHGRGVFVEAVGPDGVWGAHWMRWMLEHRPTLVELLEVREAVEGKSAWLAAKLGTATDLRRLARILRDAAALLATGTGVRVDDGLLRAYVRLDRDFHHAIAAATRNHFLVAVVEGLGSALRGSREATLAIPGRLARSLREHRRIAEAIARRDPTGARRAMERHVRRVLDEVRSMEADGGGARG